MQKELVLSVCIFISLLSQALAEPTSKFAQIALDRGANPERYIVEENLMIPMRDGARLQTSVIRPRGVKNAPTLLLRTPYDMASELEGKTLFPLLVKNGYALVFQNERGTHWSEGDFQILAGARNDGYDTLSWIAEQPWSNGRVGTFGCSSSAENQLALGAMEHPAHRAMIALSSAAGIGNIPGASFRGAFYKNGVPMLSGWTGWYSYYGHKNHPKLPANISQEERNRLILTFSSVASRFISAGHNLNDEAVAELNAEMQKFPSGDILKRAGLPSTDYDELMTLSPADAKWDKYDFINTENTGAVPTLHINAWGDYGPYETLKLYEFQSEHDDQYLIMAPTAHCDMMKATRNTMVGDRAVGDGRLEYDNLYLKWLDQNLKGRKNAFKGVPKVQTFLMGANRWITSDAWPLKNVRETKYYLHSGGRANSLYGDGVLKTTPPTSNQDADIYASDPFNPVPSKGGGCCKKRVFQDQRDIESRNDVLVYSTPVLTEGLSVVGDIKAKLYLSTSAKGGDIAVKLVDVGPDGTAFNVQDTMFRLRYRDGIKNPKATTPGEIYEVEITGIATGNYFAPGHRMRIEIAGANFPNFERNLNTGGDNYNEIDGVVSKTHIYHDPKHPSYISVPIYHGRQVADMQ